MSFFASIMRKKKTAGDKRGDVGRFADGGPGGHVFQKMQAIGNDFILFDVRTGPLSTTVEQRRRLADRRCGIGCDQLIVLEAAKDSSFSCRFYNADGGEADICGNGLRCVGHYLYARGELAAGLPMTVVCTGREVSLLAQDNGDILVDMGKPVWAADDIPADAGTVQQLATDAGTVDFTAVSIGNPHAVIRVPDTVVAPLTEWAEDPDWLSLFPQGVNIGCMEIMDRDCVRLRVYERGTGETPGCGSGACAAVAVGHHHGWLGPSVRVRMTGGDVNVACSDDGVIGLSGPTALVYEGRIVI